MVCVCCLVLCGMFDRVFVNLTIVEDVKQQKIGKIGNYGILYIELIGSGAIYESMCVSTGDGWDRI